MNCFIRFGIVLGVLAATSTGFGQEKLGSSSVNSGLQSDPLPPSATTLSLLSPIEREQWLEDHRIHRYLQVLSGRSQLILGSEDPRSGMGFMYGYGRRDPRLKWKGLSGELVWEGYLLDTESPGVNGDPPNRTTAVGVLATARYKWRVNQSLGIYASLGFGFQYVNFTSADLPLNFNTTPAIGVGFTYKTGGNEYQLGAMLLHVSNGGRRLPNPGQNFLVLSFGLRY